MATNATHPSRCLARFLLLGLAFAAFGQGAHAQVGALVSPGPLSRAHAALEGIKNCEKCHERKKQVSAARCLACHKPVAERIQAQKGVHAGVKDDCVACHVEHMGKDAELRPLDQKSFDHKGVTGFALDGMHARLSSNCGACHKTRTFLNLSPSCASCHRDPHKGTLGASCVACHSTGVAFAAARKTFDHTKSEFPLSGAHARVACAKCHAEGKFKGLAFASCASCHEDPHRKAFGPDCASCHGTETFSTQKVDHAKTRFPLKGRHAQVTCVSCHVKPAMKVRPPSGKCSDCHKDPHGGTFKKDCATCHDERGFKGATIDHATTRFPLTGKHASTPCASCHKQAAGQARTAARVFTGLASECSSCHQDVHKGALGPDCKRCHGTQTFRVETYVHPGSQDFFQGNHAQVTCKACHDRGGNGKVAAWKMTGVARTCASCHKDVHLGHLGSSCQDCHAVGGRKWQATGFRHDQSAFPLTGRHADVACQKCHRAETAAFPSGTGTGTRYRGLGKDCAACHADPHRGQFKAECSSCHDTKSFRVSSYVHKGPKGFFTAAHAKAPCQACHKKETGPFPAGPGPAIRFTGLATGCKTCHADFHEGAMGTECATCHSIEGPWRTPNRSFHKTRSFPLEGKHVNVPCSSCHLSGVFKGTPTRCYDCHWIRRKDDRFQTRLGTDCETCHIPSSWRSVIWNHASATGFALSGSHASLRCETCHVDGRFDGARPECYSCHKKDFEATRSPNHASAGFPTDCRLCHGSGTASWGRGTFTHTRWALQGNHAAAACVACHQDGRFAGLPRDCYSCHQRDFNSATNPNHLMTGFSRTCETCHKVTDANWKQGKFTHTKWALQGNHATQVCTACHRNNVFAGTPQDCSTCHQKDYTAAANPNHLAAGFPQACETCHKVTDANWKQGKFTHTKWALQGNHATQVCTACHRNNVYAGTPQDCYSCHQKDYTGAANPNHVAAGFPQACETCHKVTDANWKQGKFTHTKWALQGNHATQVCTACHRNNVFAGTPQDCYSCHQKDYTAAANPNHLAAGFPQACETCHKVTDANWKQGKFTHTKWALQGNHATQVCTACHRNNVFAGTPQDCYSCHQKDYTAAANPNHLAAGFPQACETCHKVTDANWKQGKFTHTKWALQGNHATQVCSACHRNNVYAGTPQDCYSCHQKDYTGAANPNHVAAGFPQACETCHKVTDANWKQGKFTHTKWALQGNHATQVCTACHRNNVFAGTPQDCYSCHQKDYTGAANPNHLAAGFPQACETCHKVSDASWKQGKFTHTKWALQGNHATQVCSACHKNNVYAGTPQDCYSCHQAKYTGATNPNHLAAGFPTNCESCHRVSDSSWRAGTYSHATWPLQGGHVGRSCNSCHRTNVYAGTSRQCYSCHQQSYAGATNPNHVQAGFPTECTYCHRATDSSWNQGRFDHSRWPLAGSHASQPCAACHRNGVYSGTSQECYSCHQARYQQAANPNHLAAGFSTTCTPCHKVADPNWHLGVYSHTKWPLVGAHVGRTCNTCHRNNVYSGLSSDCYSCHQASYQGARNPNHISAGFPTNCSICHRVSDTSWSQGRFDHTWFPISSGKHAGNPCSACHPNNQNYRVFTCVTCHTRSSTDSKHRGVSGYIYDSQACYACHPTGRE